MTKLFFSLLISFYIICGSQNISGQTVNNQVDANTEFKVNPNPHKIYNIDAIPIEEIFGLNQNIFGPGALRGRGNIFLCSNSRKLIEHRLYLNPTAAANLWFVVYEGITDTGNYTLINSVNVPNQGPGEAWYSSGTIEVYFESGKYYLIYAQWDVTAEYWNQNPVPPPYPIPCSFGELQSGAGWNWAPLYSDPPPATQNVRELFVDSVAYYQIIVTDDTSTSGVNEINSGGIPESFELFNNYPNPFNPTTTIYYAIPEPGLIELKVFDVLGTEIVSLVSETKDAGYHSIQFDATGCQSGIYFYRLEYGGFVETKKMVLLK